MKVSILEGQNIKKRAARTGEMKKKNDAGVSVEKMVQDMGSSSEPADPESQHLKDLSTQTGLSELQKSRYMHSRPPKKFEEEVNRLSSKHSETDEKWHPLKTISSRVSPENPGMTLSLEGMTVPAQDRRALATMVMNLFDHWNLSTEVQASLLGLGLSNRAALNRYRKGDPVGTSRDQYERVGHLLAIHRSLRLLFPENRDLAYRWMSLRNRAFGSDTPVEVIREKGFAGLLMVRSYLERALVS